MSRPHLVVIPCGARKLDHPAPAARLYTGSYFRSCQRAALALSADRGYLILSAKHGLITPSTVLAPYDMRLGEPGSVTPARLAGQAAALGVDGLDSVVVFGARDYTAAARAVWPRAVAPVAGPMGNQMRAMALIARRGRL